MRRKRELFLLLVIILLTGCAAREEIKTASIQLVRQAEPTAAPQTLSGDWYGWWHMNEVSGDWEHMDGYWWDCCASVDGGGDVFTMTLLDENLPKEQELGRAVCTVTGDELRCLTGDFLDCDLESDDWAMYLLTDEAGRELIIRGSYTAVNSEGGFRYEILLRPWGSLWPEDEERPYLYEDWYLPLIEAGQAMPDTLGNGRREA